MASVETLRKVDEADGVRGLFHGMKFFLARQVPLRSSFISEIERHGGVVVSVDSGDALVIVDHLKNKALPTDNTLTYKFIEDSIRSGFLQDKEPYKVDAKNRSSRPAGDLSTSGRSVRVPFTKDEDCSLWDYVNNAASKGVATSGRTLFQQLAAEKPRHTWQSWRDRWVKKLKDKDRPAPLETAPSPEQIPSTTRLSIAKSSSPAITPAPQSITATASAGFLQNVALSPRVASPIPEIARSESSVLEDTTSLSGNNVSISRDLPNSDGSSDSAQYEGSENVNQNQVINMTTQTHTGSGEEEYGLEASPQDQLWLLEMANDISGLEKSSDQRALNKSWESWASSYRHHSELEWRAIWEQIVRPKWLSIRPKESVFRMALDEMRENTSPGQGDEENSPTQQPVTPKASGSTMKRLREVDSPTPNSQDSLPSSRQAKRTRRIDVRQPIGNILQKSQLGKTDGNEMHETHGVSTETSDSEKSASPSSSRGATDEKTILSNAQDLVDAQLLSSVVNESSQRYESRDKDFSKHDSGSESSETPKTLESSDSDDNDELFVEAHDSIGNHSGSPQESRSLAANNVERQDLKKDKSQATSVKDTQAIFLEELPFFELDMPSPELGPEDDARNKSTADSFITTTQPGFTSQLQMHSPTPARRTSLIESSQQSSSSSRYADAAAASIQVSESDSESMETWVVAQKKVGRSQEHIYKALIATCLETHLAEIALRYLERTGELPKRWPGIWTEEDDMDLHGPDAKRVRRVLVKHGNESVQAREEFLAEQGK